MSKLEKAFYSLSSVKQAEILNCPTDELLDSYELYSNMQHLEECYLYMDAIEYELNNRGIKILHRELKAIK